MRIGINFLINQTNKTNMKTRTSIKKALIATSAILFGAAYTCKAQTDMDGTEFMTEFKEKLFENFPIATTICYGIAGLIFVVGAVRIVGKFTSKTDHVDIAKEIGIFLGAAIFFTVVGALSQKFFS